MEQSIDNYNNKFVENEKKIILNNFNSFLNSHNGFIDDSYKEKFKKEYYRDYGNFYSILGIGILIDNYNKQLIDNEKEIILNEFNSFLDSYDGYIDDSIKNSLKIKYNNNYCNYFDLLDFNSLIDDYNKDFVDDFKNILDDKYISNSEMKKLVESKKYDFDITNIIEEHNNEYIEKTLELNRPYFDNMAGTRLDKDQIRAVLTDDDVTQIVAGAGTGKTMTIQAKVKYLIEKQGISPSDILCISYSNSACDDLALKLEKTLGNNIIEVRTFHSIGFKILQIDGGNREVPSSEIKNLIDYYFKEEVNGNPELIKEVIDFFSYYYDVIYLNEFNLNLETLKYKLNKLDEFEEYLLEEKGIFKDDEKEYVNNIYELIIANYLFIHNIEYNLSKKLIGRHKKHVSVNSEEIPNNKSDIDDNDYDEFECYCNFYLPEKDIYINLVDFKPNEAAGIDKKKRNNDLEKIDNFNKKYQTQILNIYNQGNDIDIILNSLNEKLNEFGFEINELDYSALFELLIMENNLKEYNDFIKTVQTFINLFKGNAYNTDLDGNDISKRRFEEYKIENHKLYSGSLEKRNNFFLNIIEKIYNIYTQKIEDNNYIDFNDMINDAVIALKKGTKIHNYKYIIVDEYQDTSYTRYSLLKEMQISTGAKIVVVGDDWQSIYGFTGCDVSLFSKFDKFFENPKMVKIGVTYRNSQDLIDVCGEFIQKNKNQIPKKLRSAKSKRNKPIKLVEYTSRAEIVLSLMSILDEISQKDETAKVMVLGRNNHDKYDIACKEILTQFEYDDFTKIIYSKYPNLNIEFRTVHKSKGLQADYVIVLNLNDKINGFPNKIVNDSILNFVDKKFDENIDYPEERRLFYVALTRTENDVYVFHHSIRPSIFIDEIKDNNKVKNLKFTFSSEEIHKINLLLDKEFEVIETDIDCPNCNSGKVTLIINNNRGTSGFKCSNNCRWDGGSYHNIEKGERSRKISHLKYAKVCEWCNHMLVVTPRKINPKIKFLGCNHFPNCRNAKNLPRDFEDIDESIHKLNQTRHNVYYLEKYIPSDKIEEYTQDEINATEGILGYKDGDDEYLISLYTRKLMEAISYITNFNLKDDKKEINLVAVPSSKVINKNKSTLRKSINIMEIWYKNGITVQNFGFIHDIKNCKDLINRVIDVPTAHLGEGRANCEEHINSMRCNIDSLSPDQIFIILDDVTTSGETMKACKQILINNGATEKNIFTLAIGATVRGKDEEI